MTATIVEPVALTEAEIAAFYRRTVLDAHRDDMVGYLVEHHRIARPRAEAMIDQLWDRIVARIVKEFAHQEIDQPMAERILGRALAFLQLCAIDGGHGPSPLADIGWHMLILYTLEYEALCFVVAGRFLHHLPTTNQLADPLR